MAANVDAIIREGIAAYKAGRKDEARSVLLRAVEVDQYNEQAWLWLSAVVDTPEDQRTCLENVLAINPNNERARSGLDVLSEQAPPPPMPTSSASANAFPTSVEWNVPDEPLAFTGSPQATPDISDDEYDDWVANLNLPGGSSASAPPVDDTFSSPSPFGGAFFDDDDELEDLLAGEFDTGNSPFSTLDFETVFGSPEAAATMPPPPPPPPAPTSSTAPAGLMSPGRDSDDTFDDSDLRGSGIFTPFEDDDFSDVDLESLNTEELFHYIPAEIQATRLPGTRERYPLLLTLGLVLLVLLNTGAVALLIYRLM